MPIANSATRREQRDAARTAIIEDQGFRVLRYANADVMGNLEGVLASVATALDAKKGSAA